MNLMDRKYFKVVVEYKQMYEFVVMAKDLSEAKTKARDSWGEQDPIFSDIEVYNIIELGEKND